MQRIGQQQGRARRRVEAGQGMSELHRRALVGLDRDGQAVRGCRGPGRDDRSGQGNGGQLFQIAHLGRVQPFGEDDPADEHRGVDGGGDDPERLAADVQDAAVDASGIEPLEQDVEGRIIRIDPGRGGIAVDAQDQGPVHALAGAQIFERRSDGRRVVGRDGFAEAVVLGQDGGSLAELGRTAGPQLAIDGTGGGHLVADHAAGTAGHGGGHGDGAEDQGEGEQTHVEHGETRPQIAEGQQPVGPFA